MITHDAVRTALHEAWSRQACQNPADWPDAFARFMAPSNAQRTSLKPRFEATIAVLTEAYADGAPADGPALIHRAFAHLDKAHRAELHRRLVALATETTASAMVPA
jgi:hypothetical protein